MNALRFLSSHCNTGGWDSPAGAAPLNFRSATGLGLAVVSAFQLPEAPPAQMALAEVAPLAAPASGGPEPDTSSQTAPVQAGSAAGASSAQSVGQQPSGKKSRHGSAEEQSVATGSRPGSISGTVMDVNGDIITGATVVLEDLVAADRRTVVVNDRGNFISMASSREFPITSPSAARGLSPGTHLPLFSNRASICS